jgi:hypothetical protein
MKIAKKVLAVVMALAMVAGLSAMAFAAGTPTIVLVAGEVKDGKVAVDVVAKNAAGLASVDGVVTYDAAVLTVAGNPKNGAAIGYYNDGIGESVMTAYNKNEAGTVLVGIAFQDGLDDNDGFATKADDNGLEGATYDAASVVLCTINFKVADGVTADTAVKLTGGFTLTDGTKVDIAENTATIKLAAKEDGKKDEEPSKVEPKPADDKEETTKPANPSTGDKTTGDNMALAAAGAVVVLAGAAFVISKKRK